MEKESEGRWRKVMKGWKDDWRDRGGGGEGEREREKERGDIIGDMRNQIRRVNITKQGRK